jgi:quercetin dioxygenase-like cupin family protein
MVLCLGAVSSWSQSYPPPFPREAAQKLFENERVAVWDVTWPKGLPSAMHQHPVDQLSITLRGGSVRVTRLGGAPAVSESQPGKVVFTPQGTIHMEEGVSEIPQRKIMLQLKSLGPPVTAASGVPGAFPREGAVKLLENDRVIAWDFTWKPGQNIGPHENLRESVMVFLEGGTIRSISDQNGSKDAAVRAGEVMYSIHGGDARTEEAIQGSPRAIVVELK